MMTTEQAIRHLRRSERYRDLIRDAYLGADVVEEARRFAASAEFAEVLRIAHEFVRGGSVVDLGSGAGVAAYAFAVHGARVVYAVDPDLSAEIGAVAARSIGVGLPIHSIGAVGEAMPLRDQSIDLVYARQVLHHTRDLGKAVRECARVLRPGGFFMATREHVVDNPRQLQQFLKTHPVHRLAGGEHAFSLYEYRDALLNADLCTVHEIGPWDSVINAFPEVRTTQELSDFPSLALRRRLGPIGSMLSRIPASNELVWTWLRTRRPAGRLFSFTARKV